MKRTILLAVCFLLGSVLHSQAKTYAEAENELGWLAVTAADYRQSMKEAIRAQTENLDVLNRLTQAKISMDEEIQRSNIAKACKVVDVAFTVGTVGVGGVALAAEKGLSVLSQEGARIAAKYIAKKGAIEAAKEGSGVVPGYSDSVKVGVYIFNKVDANETKGQLSKDNIDLLIKARQLMEVDFDGKTLAEKRPELRQIVAEAEGKLEKTATQIKALDHLIEELMKKGALLGAEAEKLKEQERKEAEKEAEKAKKAEPKGLVKTNEAKPAEVPPAPIGPKDTPDEKRRKTQESLDKYINSLITKINGEKKAADDAWTALKKPELDMSADAAAEVKYMMEALATLEGGLTGSGSYTGMQSLERSAGGYADRIKKNNEQFEAYSNGIKAGIEPIIVNISGYTGQWRTVYDTYKPQGYYVSAPDDVRTMTVWNAYYEPQLKQIEAYKAGTEGLAGKFTDLASKAAARKDAIYAQAKGAAEAYSAKIQEFTNYKPQTTAQLQKLVAALSKKAEPVFALPHEFVAEFAYNGKADLTELEPKVSAAKAAFSEMQGLAREGALLYYDLLGRFAELNELRQAPLMNEAASISYMAENKAHKDSMASMLKKSEEYSPEMGGLEGVEEYLKTSVPGASAMVFGAEDAMRYLRAAETRMLDTAGKAASAIKTNLSGDVSRLKTASAEEYGEEMERLFKPSAELGPKLREIQEEVRSTFLFDPSEELKPQKLTVRNTQYGQLVEGKQPLLFQTGFWPASVAAKTAEVEKVSADFWSSGTGKEITEARRLTELAGARDKRDPGLAAVRKMYDGFREAYEARSAARVMSFISPDWTAGDGTTAADLDEQFARIFRLFDEIRVELTGLQIVNDGGGRYTASYNMAIKSRIYKKNIKREEDSSVYEHVEVSGDSAKIKKTEAGGYWNVK